MKKWVLVLLTVMMFVCGGTTVCMAEIVASGNCGKQGNNLTWTLDDVGTLTISGSGEMANYYNNKPWDAYHYPENKLKSLVIEQGITSIGQNAFSFCSGFTGSLIIPDSVTNIGNSAFDNCSGFTGNLIIPNSVTSIGDYAFEYCTGFTGSLTIPDSVTSIGNGAFFYCNGLSGSLTIPNSVTNIGMSAFSYCSGFTGSLTISNSVTTINSFYGCSGFTGRLTIPDSVTTIGYQAFYGCSGFTGSLTIPDHVTSILADAFNGCSGLSGSLTIPASVTTIQMRAFHDCDSFTDIYYTGSQEAWNNIIIDDNNEILSNATIHYNSNTPLGPDLDDGGIELIGAYHNGIIDLLYPKSATISAMIPNGSNLEEGDITWEIEDEDVARITDEAFFIEGNVAYAGVTIKSLRNGTTSLILTTTDGRTKRGNIIVYKPGTTGVIVSTSNGEINESTIRAGLSIQLVADVYPAEILYPKVTWASSNTDVATVDQNGNVRTKEVGEVKINRS